eukprot:jgi/Bigna1/128243/aug1.6_g2951
MKIDTKLLQKHDVKSSSSRVEEEDGVVELRRRLQGKKGTTLGRVLRDQDSWSWGKADLTKWVEIMDEFDSLLEKACKGKLGDDLTIEILRFTELLLKNCFDARLYNSHERLLGLLDNDNPMVVAEVLAVFDTMCERMRKELKFTYPGEGDQKECVIDLAQIAGTGKTTLRKNGKLAKKYQNVPDRYKYSLKHHLNFARAFSDEIVRTKYVMIKLMAIRLAMCFSWSRNEWVQKYFKSNPHLTEMLLDLLQNSHLIPLDVTVLTVHCLKSLTQVPYVETRMRDLRVLTDGVIPSLLLQCITRLKTNPDSAPDLLLTGALLSFIQKISSENILLAYNRTLRPADIMDWMVSLISNLAIKNAMVLMRALRIIEKLIAPSRDLVSIGGVHHSVSRSRFHQANGFDICLKRLQQIYVNSPGKREGLTYIRKRTKTMATGCAGHLLGKCVKAFLRVASISVRQSRRPIRSDLLKEGEFSNIIITLWRMSQGSAKGACGDNMESKESENKSSADMKGPPLLKKRRKTEASSSSSLASEASSSMQVSTDPKRRSAKELLGDKIFALSCALLCNVIQNRPACTKTLHANGVTKVFLQTLHPGMFQTEAVIKTVPETIRSLCFSSDALKTLMMGPRPLEYLFNLVSSHRSHHLDILTIPALHFLAKSLEELIKHFPAFVTPAMNCCKKMLMDLAENYGCDSNVPMENYRRCIVNVAFFLTGNDGRLAQVLGKKVVMGVLPDVVQALYEKEAAKSSMKDICFKLCEPMVRITNQEPTKMAGYLLERCIKRLDAVIQSDSYKTQKFLTWREDEVALVKEVQQLTHIHWYMSVLLRLSRKSVGAMLKHNSFKIFVEKVSRVVCLCKWNFTSAMAENPELMKKRGAQTTNESRAANQQETASNGGKQQNSKSSSSSSSSSSNSSSSSSSGGSKEVLNKQADDASSDPTKKSGNATKDSKKRAEFLEKYRDPYCGATKNVFLMAGKLIRFLTKFAKSSNGSDYVDLIEHIIMMYLEFKPAAELKGWTSLFHFSKASIKLCSSMLLSGSSYEFSTGVFKAFSQKGGTASVMKIFKWLLDMPAKPGQDAARASHFLENPWGIDTKLLPSPRALNAAQALIGEIGKFISSLSSHVPKSVICVEFVTHGLKTKAAVHGVQFCTSVVTTARRLLDNRENVSGKKKLKEEDLIKLVSMGFRKSLAIHALRKNRYNLQFAMEWLLNNPDDPLDADAEVDDVDFQKSLAMLDSKEFLRSLLLSLRALSKANAASKAMDKYISSVASLLIAMCTLDDKNDTASESSKNHSVDEKVPSNSSSCSRSSSTVLKGLSECAPKETKGAVSNANTPSGEESKQESSSHNKWRRDGVVKDIIDIIKTLSFEAPTKGPKTPSGKHAKTKANTTSRTPRGGGSSRSKAAKARYVRQGTPQEMYIFFYLLAILVEQDEMCRKIAVKNNALPILLSQARRIADFLHATTTTVSSLNSLISSSSSSSSSSSLSSSSGATRKRKGSTITENENRKKLSKNDARSGKLQRGQSGPATSSAEKNNSKGILPTTAVRFIGETRATTPRGGA